MPFQMLVHCPHEYYKHFRLSKMVKLDTYLAQFNLSFNFPPKITPRDIGATPRSPRCIIAVIEMKVISRPVICYFPFQELTLIFGDLHK